jgi:hypothetical protein
MGRSIAFTALLLSSACCLDSVGEVELGAPDGSAPAAAPAPAALKIVFAVDGSGSMAVSDRTDSRAAAIATILGRLSATNVDVSFAVLVFAGDATAFVQPVGAARFETLDGAANADLDELAQAIGEHSAPDSGQNVGSDNFLDPLQAAASLIASDLALAGASQASYRVVFMTDTTPTFPEQAQISAAISGLVALGSVTLDAVGVAPDPATSSLLQTMATLGQGQFVAFPSDTPVDLLPLFGFN